MRSWSYLEPNDPINGDWTARTITLTENEILEQGYVRWARNAMSWNERHPHRQIPIMPLACIEDYVVLHWAVREPM